MKKSGKAIRKELGEKIRKIREGRGLTQAQVAAQAEMDVNYYARIERGLGNPSYEKLYYIMDALRAESWSFRGKE